MAGSLVGQLAAELPWLCPSATSLLALAEHPTPELLRDPTIALLALRFARPSITPETSPPGLVAQPLLAEAAAAGLERTPSAWLPANHPVAITLDHAVCSLHKIAAEAIETGAYSDLCPHNAMLLATVLPLGWLALATIDPDQTELALDSNDSVESSDRFGLSERAITRRLVTRWKIPQWAGATLANIHHEPADAIRFGAHPQYDRFLREVLVRSAKAGFPLGFSGESVESVATPTPREFRDIENPYELKLLPRLLRMAAKARKSQAVSTQHLLDNQTDQLHQYVRQSRQEFRHEVRAERLAGLAELAAGAGHEINNPLAVIVGTAQLLRSKQLEPDQQRPLDTIIRQSRRITDILHELMQFARPTPAVAKRFRVDAVFADVVAELSKLANEKALTITPSGDTTLTLEADPIHTHRALSHLVRNAIEAAPRGGTVSLVCRSLDASRIAIEVQDSGPGPLPHAVPYLFDPFFSGRAAGRARGFGLPTAWRLATLNGGYVDYRPQVGGPTCFVLVLPSSTAAFSERKLAS